MSNGVPAPSSPRKQTQPHAKAVVGFNLWTLVEALRRHWLLACVLGSLFAGVAGASVWFFLPPGKHEVTRVMHVVSQPLGFLDPQRGPDFGTYKQTQVALLRSRKVLNVALRNPKVADSAWLKQTPDPLRWLEQNLRVNFPGGGEIMHISLAGAAEEMPLMTALVDAVADAFLSEIVEADRQHGLQRETQLRQIAGVYAKKITEIKASMKGLREAAGAGDPESLVLMQRLALKEHDAVFQDLTRSRNKIRTLRIAVEQQGKETPQDATVSLTEELQKALPADARLAELKSKRDTAKRLLDREAKKTPQGTKFAGLQHLVREVSDLEQDVKTREGEVRKLVVDRLEKDKKRNATLGVGGLRQELAAEEELEKILTKHCERLAREGKEANAKGIGLQDFDHDLKEFDSMRAALVRKADVLSVEAHAPPRISRLDQEALVVAPNEQARKIQFSGLAAVGAVGLLLAGICLLELRIQRVTSPSDLAKTVGLTVIGVLPFYRPRKGGVRAAQRLKEAVDDARTLLLHQAAGRGLKTLMVTSAVSGEGKTSLACHLAASLARAGRRTLLIDADLRKPDAHNIFGRPNNPGLCEVFRSEVPLGQAIQDMGFPGLKLLPAGKCCDRALRAVAQASFAKILGELRQEYDFIIIDSSPVLEVPDALMLGQDADGVLFAVMQGESRCHRLNLAAERFARLDAPIVGMIISAASDDKGGYDKVGYGKDANAPVARGAK